MKVQKISPIAKYLTENKAVTVRDGNICHFYDKNGWILGKQEQIQEGGATAYIREIFGEGLKSMFIECKMLSQECAYYPNEKAPLGISIMPFRSHYFSQVIDFLSNKVHSQQKEVLLTNRTKLITVDENTGAGLYYIEKPFHFKENLSDSIEETLDEDCRIKHTIN